MKKILSLVLSVALIASLALALVACGGAAEKTYTLAVVTDSSFGKNNKVTNVALALVIGEDNKVVAARFDSNEVAPALDAEGNVVAVDSVESKVEKGDNYTGMPAGPWYKQAQAFEAAIVGKTADEVANLDASNYAGCTMQSTTPVFKALVAKAFAYTNKVTFKTAETITTGLAMDMTVKSGRGGSVTVGADIAGVVMAGDKVVACAIDSVEQSFTKDADGALTHGETAAVSKNEQGEGYTGMPAGPWYKQAQAFANSAVGKTVAELADMETVSDALAEAGCTMQNTPAGYKVTIISAAGYAR